MDGRNGALRAARDFLCGALIGAGAILPGVSGGVLAVVFDIYRPLMEVLTHPRRALPRYWRWIPALALGWCAGFWGFARGITLALHLSASVTTWLFIGLIAGTLPQLFRQAGRQGRPRGAWIVLGACFCAVFFVLFYAGSIARVHVEPNFWWYSFCGALWGMSVVIPGLTSSSILMALDLYEPLMDGLSRMDVGILWAVLPGMLAAIALLARLVSWLFRRYYAHAFHGILGIVLATTLVIIPTAYRGAWELIAGAACCAAGFLIALLLGKLDGRMGE